MQIFHPFSGSSATARAIDPQREKRAQFERVFWLRRDCKGKRGKFFPVFRSGCERWKNLPPFQFANLQAKGEKFAPFGHRLPKAQNPAGGLSAGLEVREVAHGGLCYGCFVRK